MIGWSVLSSRPRCNSIAVNVLTMLFVTDLKSWLMPAT